MNARCLCAVVAALSLIGSARSGVLDTVWLKGVTDKNPLTYKCGERIVFTVEPVGLECKLPEGEYYLKWRRSDDHGNVESGKEPFTGNPFVYHAMLEEPGFVRLSAYVVDKEEKRYVKKFVGDSLTPEGHRAMNEFEKSKKNVFFDGGAAVEPALLRCDSEPDDFDLFWVRQFDRLDKVPINAERVELESPDVKVKLYAIMVDCAGLRPVTGYLSLPKAAECGSKFPCHLKTHGYNGGLEEHCPPRRVADDEIVLNINAHGQKLAAFGATESDLKALRWEVRSNGCTYGFDPKQNKDPETAYFNGMVLRVKRALQYLKTVEGWNGKDLIASGGSQGGLQTIWAAGCGEGVTCAESGVTWCCDMRTNSARKEKEMAGDGWYVPWTESMGYYDAVNWAKRIPLSCRTIITRAGLGDYTCPPMGLMKLWNNIPGNKRIVWVQGSEHGYVPPKYVGRDFVFEE